MEVLGLEALEGLILDTILTKAGAKATAAVACVSTRLTSAASEESLWRRFCSDDLDLDFPLDPDGNPCPSYLVTYRAWVASFGMYPLPLVKRVKKLWTAIRSWMAANFPRANDTLRKGASEAEIKEAEEILGVKFPASTKLLYRFCDGQDTAPPNIKEHRRLASLGIIGGYEFYDHLVNVHMLPLSHVVRETRVVARMMEISVRSKNIVVASSYYNEKWFFLNCASGQLHVGTGKLLSDGEMLPCVPKGLVNMSQDGLLLWLEEHYRRLQSGRIKTRMLRKSKFISLLPETPPACSVEVTNGVKVRASAVLVPELSDSNDADWKYIYTCYIRLSLLPEGCMLDGVYHSSCQLSSRHWIIRAKDTVVSGVAEVGMYPLLTPNGEEFAYASFIPLPDSPGSVKGSFAFVPGSLGMPKGRQFDVQVAPFTLEAPEYIF